VGLYGYRADVLARWETLPDSPLEAIEKLEQLRLLEAGIAISTFAVAGESLSVDTAEQLEQARALAAAGAQVLDLEALACHRGSILGGLPTQPQPAQKRFDTQLWQALRGFSPARPVFVESESARIGRLTVPVALLQRMRETGRVVAVEMADAARLQLLLADYGFFAQDPEHFCRLLEGLVELRGRARVTAWQALARAGRWEQVFGELMAHHYDPLYQRSLARSYGSLDGLHRLDLGDGGPEALAQAAQALRPF
jgi:tRNA 2-selenouridine synthase